MAEEEVTTTTTTNTNVTGNGRRREYDLFESLPVWTKPLAYLIQKLGISTVLLLLACYYIVGPLMATYQKYIDTTAQSIQEMAKATAQMKESMSAVEQCEREQMTFFKNSQDAQKQGLQDHRDIMHSIKKS